METDGLAPFLFEIASDLRLRILALVAERPLKHAEIARRLAMTGSEATRHLNRLSAAGLLEKTPQGGYALTTLATTLRAGLPFFEFLTRHRAFLATHDALVVGSTFVERLGELRRGEFVHGTYEVVATQEESLRRVERQIWAVTEQPFERGVPIFREKVRSGVDVRVIRPRGALEEELRGGKRVVRNYPVRGLEKVPVFLAVLDDEAALCLPALDGRIDMASMLLLNEPEGFRWAKDLFLDLWNRATERRIVFPPASGASRPHR